MRRRPILLATLVTVSVLLASASASASASALPRTLTTGIADSVYGLSANPGLWMQRTTAAGAQSVNMGVNWMEVARRQPAPGTDPSNPANPAYSWGNLDKGIRAAIAHKLRVTLSIVYAPQWDEGPNKPPDPAANAGTWEPNAAAFGAFVKAVARRYSGSFKPVTGGVLPRVRYFQAWTEPNLPNHLTPQWVRVGGHFVAESPIIYRSLLNAAYTAVKAVNRSDQVLVAGMAPYGDLPGGARVRPARFVRDLLCVTGQLKPAPCPNPAHFDIFAHNPYDFGGPLNRSVAADDVSLPDMGRLIRVLRAAERLGRALPRIQHPVWVTEFGWNTNPPTRNGVALLKRARWIEQAFWVLWSQGISNMTIYSLVDQPLGQPYVTWQAGLYYRNGQRKPGFEAFRFPFVVPRVSRGRAQVWTVPPVSGMVRIQARKSGRWVTLARIRARAHGVINRQVAISGRHMLRGVIGSNVSLGWQA